MLKPYLPTSTCENNIQALSETTFLLYLVIQLTEWQIPHIKTEILGSWALNNFFFWWKAFIFFFFSFVLVTLVEASAMVHRQFISLLLDSSYTEENVSIQRFCYNIFRRYSDSHTISFLSLYELKRNSIQHPLYPPMCPQQQHLQSSIDGPTVISFGRKNHLKSDFPYKDEQFSRVDSTWMVNIGDV